MIICSSHYSFHAQDIHDTFEQVEIIYHKNIKKTFTDLSSVKVFSLDKQPESSHQTLDNFLQINSSVFIKKLGINSLTTLSLRGASSSQSLVLWEGIPIQNTMNGATDISLFNAGLFEQIDLEYDGNSSLYGSGNVGGALSLHSNFNKEKEHKNHSGISIGSFDNYAIYNKLFLNHKQNRFYIKAIGHHGRNDFPYQYLSQSHHLTNASNTSLSILAGWENDNIFHKKKNRPITSVAYHFWYQGNEREIPPAFFEAFSSKIQNESSFRQTLKVTRGVHNNHLLYIHSSLFHDIHRYSDTAAFIRQHLNSNNLYTEIGIKNKNSFQSKLFHFNYLFFVPIQYTDLRNNISGSLYQNAFTGFSGILQSDYNSRIHLQLNVRKEFNRNYSIPFLYGLKTAYHHPTFQFINLHHNIHIFYSLQKSFRAPLLHELHQFPGGNSELKPEHGTNSEIGIKSLHISDNNRYKLNTQIVYFDRMIHDWIYWLGATIWTPYNISKVKSYGWDIQIQNKYFITPEKNIHLNIDHNYTIATTIESLISNNNSAGKQIPYTPRYNTRINTGFSIKNWTWNLHAGYTGYVFTSLDESSYLKPYTLISSSLSFPIVNIRKHRIAGTLTVQNIFNTEYYTIQNRPMPGTNYTFSLHLIPV